MRLPAKLPVVIEASAAGAGLKPHSVETSLETTDIASHPATARRAMQHDFELGAVIFQGGANGAWVLANRLQPMWPVASRGSRGADVAPHPKDLPVFSEFARNGESMKVWIPQRHSERLDWISKQEDVSRPDVLRALMFEHLYRRVAYMALLASEAERAAEVTLSEARRMARRGAVGQSAAGTGSEVFGNILKSADRGSAVDIEFIGKSTNNLRFELPRRLKVDLAEVARVHRLTPSHYTRKMLVQQLLGESVHTNWQEALGKIGRDIEQLERDES